MAKFLKSIFNTSDRRKVPRHESEIEEDKTDGPPLDERRKLSISRSGRLKQANKKRHSLSLDLYGEKDSNGQPFEKPKSLEYHVHTPVTAPADLYSSRNQRRRSADAQTSDRDPVSEKSIDYNNKKSKSPENKHRRITPQSPEEEIDSAFEIIDKS